MAPNQSSIDENRLSNFIPAIVELTTGVATATSPIKLKDVVGLKKDLQ